MHGFIKGSIISVSLAGMAFGIAFFSQYKAPTKNKEEIIVEVPETPQEKLLNSLGSISYFDVKADIDISLDYGGIIRLNFDGKGNASDPSNISLSGDMKLNLDGNNINASLAYVDSNLYFDYNQNYFKLSTDSLKDFVDMLPSLGVSFDMPIELSNLDMGVLEDEILAMPDPVKEFNGNGYFFTFNLSERLDLDNNIMLYITTNDDYEFTGIRTDTFAFKTTIFNKIDIKLDRKEFVEVYNPAFGEHASDYQDFAPFFTIYQDVYQLTKKRQQTFNIALDLDKYTKDEDEVETSDSFIEADIDFSYDLDNKAISLRGGISENNRLHEVVGAYQNKAIYVGYHDVKVSIQTESISAMLEWVMTLIGDEKISETLNDLTSTIDTEKIINIVNDAEKALGSITLTSEELGINLMPSEMGLENVSDFSVTLKFDDQTLQSLSINNLRIKDFEADVVLTIVDEYRPYTVIESEFVALEPALPLVNAIAELIDDNEYRIEFDALIESEDDSKEDVTINGGLQFNVSELFGYGELDIIDRDQYRHNIKADMRSQDNIIFSYNNTLNGKFNTNTLLELFDLVKEIVTNPDEHFFEILKNILGDVDNIPLMDIIQNKDIGLLLDQHIISNLSADDGCLGVDINLALVGLRDTTFHTEIHFTQDKVSSLNISNLTIGGNTISANIYLKEFDPSLESSRLNPQKEYMDFSDIKVLLELGINSSKYNYWHFDANAQVKFTVLGISFDKDIPLDVKVRNDHSKVTAAFELKDIPTVGLINGNDTYYSADNRKASIYYEDNTIYIKRTETVREHWYSISHKTYTLVKVCDVDYFFDNIVDIMCRDILSLKDLIMNEITKAATGSDDYQIPYEKILKSFIYNEKESYFYFDIDIGALTNSESLTGLNLTVYDDLTTNELTGLKASLNISVGITIQINLDATLINHEREATDSNIIQAVEQYKVSYSHVINDYLAKKAISDNVMSSEITLI